MYVYNENHTEREREREREREYFLNVFQDQATTCSLLYIMERLKFGFWDRQPMVWMLNVVSMAILCRYFGKTAAIFRKFCFNKKEQVSVVFLVKIIPEINDILLRIGSLWS